MKEVPKKQQKDELEKSVEKRLSKRVDYAGGMCLKLYTISFRGLPDRLIVMPGRKIYFVETKRRKKGKATEPSKFQTWVHKKFRATGFKVWIVNDNESLELFMQQIISEQ